MKIRYETVEDNFVREKIHNGETYEDRITRMKRTIKHWNVLGVYYCCDEMKAEYKAFDFHEGAFGIYHYDDGGDYSKPSEKMTAFKHCPFCGEVIEIKHVRHSREVPVVERKMRKTCVYVKEVVAREVDVIVRTELEIEEPPEDTT